MIPRLDGKHCGCRKMNGFSRRACAGRAERDARKASDTASRSLVGRPINLCYFQAISSGRAVELLDSRTELSSPGRNETGITFAPHSECAQAVGPPKRDFLKSTNHHRITFYFSVGRVWV